MRGCASPVASPVASPSASDDGWSALGYAAWLRQRPAVWGFQVRGLSPLTERVVNAVCTALATVVNAFRERPSARIPLLLDEACAPLTVGYGYVLDLFFSNAPGNANGAANQPRLRPAALHSFVYALATLGGLEAPDWAVIVMWAEQLERRRPGSLRLTTVRPILLAATSLYLRQSHDGITTATCIDAMFHPLLGATEATEPSTAVALARRELAFLKAVDWHVPLWEKQVAVYHSALVALCAA